MFMLISNKHLKTLENIMSKFLDDFHAALATVAAGNAVDQATKDAVAVLNTRMNDNDSSDAEFKTAITELVNKLAVSTPPVV